MRNWLRAGRRQIRSRHCMSARHWIVRLLLVAPMGIAGATTGDEVRDTLLEMLDQHESVKAELQDAVRRFGESSYEVSELRDQARAHIRSSVVVVRKIVETTGWPTADRVGAAAADAAFLVVANADVEQQRPFLDVLQEQAQLLAVDAAVVAEIEDRIRVADGAPQRFGTQLRNNPGSGRREFSPIQDCAEIDFHRQSVGLEPLAKYAAEVGIPPPFCPAPRETSR